MSDEDIKHRHVVNAAEARAQASEDGFSFLRSEFRRVPPTPEFPQGEVFEIPHKDLFDIDQQERWDDLQDEMRNYERELEAYIQATGKSQGEIEDLFARLDARTVSIQDAASQLDMSVDKMFSYKKSFKNMEDIGIVQFECTSFLRGATFDNAVVILDECQDTNTVEFETVLTRLGRNARMFVVGDIWQNDLGSKSGFNEVFQVLQRTEGVSIVEFGVEDIVRSGFVKNYLTAKYKR